MLSSEEFQQWNLSRRWSQTTTGVVADIRAALPARRVRSRLGNVSGRYPSQKMGLTIQFESHTVELAGIYQMEYDSADFFVLRQEQAGWIELENHQRVREIGDSDAQSLHSSQLPSMAMSSPVKLTLSHWDFTTDSKPMPKLTGYYKTIFNF